MQQKSLSTGSTETRYLTSTYYIYLFKYFNLIRNVIHKMICFLFVEPYRYINNFSKPIIHPSHTLDNLIIFINVLQFECCLDFNVKEVYQIISVLLTSVMSRAQWRQALFVTCGPHSTSVAHILTRLLFQPWPCGSRTVRASFCRIFSVSQKVL